MLPILGNGMQSYQYQLYFLSKHIKKIQFCKLSCSTPGKLWNRHRIFAYHYYFSAITQIIDMTQNNDFNSWTFWLHKKYRKQTHTKESSRTQWSVCSHSKISNAYCLCITATFLNMNTFEVIG